MVMDFWLQKHFATLAYQRIPTKSVYVTDRTMYRITLFNIWICKHSWTPYMCQCGLSIACGSLLYINTAESCSTKIVKSTQTWKWLIFISLHCLLCSTAVLSITLLATSYSSVIVSCHCYYWVSTHTLCTQQNTWLPLTLEHTSSPPQRRQD